MGNVFSRVSLRESLLRVEERIAREERHLKELKMTLRNVQWRSWAVYLAGMVLGGAYAYMSGQGVLQYSAECALVCYFVKVIVAYIYQSRIQNAAASLEMLKERQKEQIEELKKESSFESAKKLIDKYETDSARREYFGRFRQKEKGVAESVTDLVLGDEPSVMYALICRKCRYHNGLVHPSEYGATEFRCYNCDELNSKTKKE